MKKLFLTLSCAALFGALGVRTASADTFAFTLAGIDNGSGTFTATATGVTNQYLITNMNGTINGLSVTSLLPVGTYPGTVAPNDNLLYFPATIVSGGGSPASYFDLNGVSFTLTGGGDYNLYFGEDFQGDPFVYNLTYGPGGDSDDFLDSFTLTDLSAPTPEPASLLLFGTGAMGLVGVMRRRLAGR